MYPVVVRAYMSDSESGDVDAESEALTGVVLDFFPHGRAADDRPQYEKSPLAYVLTEGEFALYELVLEPDVDVQIGDRVTVATGADTPIERYREVAYDDLSSGATAELEYVVADVVSENEGRFVDFYNDAEPITLRLHQLNLLPGIGKKLRNNILDVRDRRPFESFEDLESRVSGLHNPEEVLVERILEELRAEDLKYRTFVGADADDAE
jgi:putative nucleotide binding protein